MLGLCMHSGCIADYMSPFAVVKKFAVPYFSGIKMVSRNDHAEHSYYDSVYP